jgi:hypothetical protein
MTTWDDCPHHAAIIDAEGRAAWRAAVARVAARMDAP